MYFAILKVSQTLREHTNTEDPRSTAHEASLRNPIPYTLQSSEQIASHRGPVGQKLVYPFRQVGQPRYDGAPTFPGNYGPISSGGWETQRANAASVTQVMTLSPEIIAVKPQGTPTPDVTPVLGAPFEGMTAGDLEARVRRGSDLKTLVMEIQNAENTTAMVTNSGEVRWMHANVAIDTPPTTPVVCSNWADNSPGLSPCFESPFRSEKTHLTEASSTRIISALHTLHYQLGLETLLNRGGVCIDTGSVPHKVWMSDHGLYARIAKEFRPPTPPISDETGPFEDLESPPDIIIVVDDILTRFLILLRAEEYFLLSVFVNCDMQQTAFALFEALLAILKDLTYMNDAEFPETGNGDEETGKFRFEGRPCQMFQQGPHVCFSFKPVGTTALNKSLCSLLHKVTGPIQIQGKYPLKTFDGSSKGRADKVEHKRRIAEREYQSFLDAARPLWGNLSAKKQQRLCKGVVDALIVLFLYWGYYLCLEKRLHLTENDRQKVKKACQDQLEKITLACIDKGGRIRGSSFVMIYQDAEECHYGDHENQSRNNSRSGRYEDCRDNSSVRERSRSRARSQSSYGRPASSSDAFAVTAREDSERIDKHWRAEQSQFEGQQQHECDCGTSTQERKHQAQRSISSTSNSSPRNFDNSTSGVTYGEPKDLHRYKPKIPTASDLRGEI
ncbi:hypothetical protein EV426DRAFT_641270 [Tirmania nivea]|nr:hypothetical protein EV426DRAFT_641270 [Tirmania nivea]